MKSTYTKNGVHSKRFYDIVIWLKLSFTRGLIPQMIDFIMTKGS